VPKIKRSAIGFEQPSFKVGKALSGLVGTPHSVKTQTNMFVEWFEVEQKKLKSSWKRDTYTCSYVFKILKRCTQLIYNGQVPVTKSERHTVHFTIMVIF